MVILFVLAGLLLAAAAISFFTFDERVFSYLPKTPQKWSKTPWAEALKLLGRSYALIWLLLTWVVFTGRYKTVVICLLSMLLVLAAVTVIKETVRRQRPRDVSSAESKVESRRAIFRNWSFPSGDTASVFGAGTVLAFAMPWPATLLFAVCCCGVGILRVVVLAHYPSDVLGGAAAGILCGCAAICIKNRYPGVENVLKGKERLLSLAGIIIIPIIFWLFKDREDFVIFLEFYVPIALIVGIVGWKWLTAKKRVSGEYGLY